MERLNTSDLRIPDRRFRPELEGIRAVAALLVAVYHIWLGSVSGGVDVFFIVSGYLITTTLLSRLERDGRIQLAEYWLGLGKRLLPLAALVLLFSVIGSMFLLPQVQWRQMMSEVYASLFYFQNWQLAANAVDYLAQNNAAGPLQHFWALSIQGQFYLIWPLIIGMVFVLATRRVKTPVRKTLLLVLTAIFAASLAYSIQITARNQPWAYFDTFARMWEFSLGGIAALCLPYVRLGQSVSAFLGWVGLGLIALTGVLLPVSTVFPGYAALLPITGAILIMAAAEQGSRFGVERLLGSKPFVYFGGISYGFYLWHWPLLIFYYAWFRTDSVSLPGGVAILLATFVLSVASTKLLESPIRRLSVLQAKKQVAALMAAMMILVLSVNASWSLYFDLAQEAFWQQINIEDYPGARVHFEHVEAVPDLPPITTPVGASSPFPAYIEDECYVGMHDSGLKVCSYGETGQPEYIIALVGGSRAGHWFPALEQIAEELRLQIDVYNKDACRFTTQDFNGHLSESCMEWNELVVEALMDHPPDLIFTTANVGEDPTVPEGYMEMWAKFEGMTPIFAIRDNPSMPEDVPLCVEVWGVEDCAAPRDRVLAEIPPWENTTGLPSNVYFADLTDYLCDEERCHAVIGNVLVYRDPFHLSTLYAMTLAEPLKEHLVQALQWLEEEWLPVGGEWSW